MIRSSSACDVGLKRQHNEDQVLSDDDTHLYVVCDGLGGHAAGEVASQMAVESLVEQLHGRSPEIEQADGVVGGHYRLLQTMEGAVQGACEQIHARAEKTPEQAGMGTTLTALLIVGGKGLVAHVGDTRLYLLRDQRLHCLTIDHTVENELLRDGADPDLARKYAHALTRSLGFQSSVQVDTLLFDVIPGDRFLVCSDGLTKHVDELGIARVLKGEGVDTAPSAFVDEANRLGGSDNISAVVVHVSGTNEAPGRERLLDTLECLPVFRSLSYRRRLYLFDACTPSRLAAGETLVGEGEEFPGLTFLVEGALEIGEGDILDDVGDVIGLPSLTQTWCSPVTVKASRDSLVLIMSREGLDTLALRRPRLGGTVRAELLRLAVERFGPRSQGDTWLTPRLV